MKEPTNKKHCGGVTAFTCPLSLDWRFRGGWHGAFIRLNLWLYSSTVATASLHGGCRVGQKKSLGIYRQGQVLLAGFEQR